MGDDSDPNDSDSDDSDDDFSDDPGGDDPDDGDDPGDPDPDHANDSDDDFDDINLGPEEVGHKVARRYRVAGLTFNKCTDIGTMSIKCSFCRLVIKS